MSFMFHSCFSLTSIPFFDTSSVIDMDSMLMSCSSLIDLPLLDFSTVNSI
jgi:surface protein